MRSFLFLLSFLCLFCAAEAQSIAPRYTIADSAVAVCTYSLHFRDSQAADSLQEETFQLYIGKNQLSKFASLKEYAAEELVNQYHDNAAMLMSSFQQLPKSRFSYQLFKDHQEGVLFYRERVSGTSYEYQEALEGLMQWQMHPETKSISSYACQKATTHFAGRDYVAWFTMEVPIADGPYKFAGLPGLIVQVYDTEQDYIFTLQQLKNLSEQPPILQKKESNFMQVSKEQFNKAVANFQRAPMQQLKQAGITIKLSEEQKKNVQQKMTARDNPIELL